MRNLIYQHNNGPEEWREVKFMIFDHVPPLCSDETFEQRIERVAKCMRPQPNVELVEMVKCTGFDQLHCLLSHILEKVTQSLFVVKGFRKVKALYFANLIRNMTTDKDQIRCLN